MNRNMIQWLLWLVCIFVVVGEVLGCPPLGEPPRAFIDGLEEKYEFSATGVKVIFSGSAGDDGYITNYKWQFPSGMTLVAEPPANCQSCGTGCLENGTGACNLTSCTFTSTGKYTITFTVTDDDDMTDSATCHIYISNVVSVEWETYPDDVVATPVDHGPNIDIDTDVHPCQPPSTTAKRIFPGKKVYDDTLAERNMRRKVLAKVTISNTFTDIPDPGFPIWIELHDVDDPSANDYELPAAQCTAPLDCDDPSHSAFSSFEDNKGGMDYRFSFTNGWDCDCGYVASGSDDVGIVMLTSHLPGNNVRVVAGTTWNLDVWDEVTWERVDSDSGAGLPSQVERSDMLTSWRKLHIEQDSMEAVELSGWQKNLIAATTNGASYDFSTGKTTVDLGLSLWFDEPHFDEEDHFKFGTYVPFDVGGSGTSIANTLVVPAPGLTDELTVDDDYENALPEDYWLFDDDDKTILPAYPDLGGFALEFNRAYIEPCYPAEVQDLVFFELNLDTAHIGSGEGAWNDQHDWSSSDDFWVAFACIAYQPQAPHDIDPGTELAKFGAERYGLFGIYAYKNETCIYVETIRDWDPSGICLPVEKVLAHELGHTGGPGDNECEPDCIMWPDINAEPGDHFCNKCLHDFRKDEDW